VAPRSPGQNIKKPRLVFLILEQMELQTLFGRESAARTFPYETSVRISFILQWHILCSRLQTSIAKITQLSLSVKNGGLLRRKRKIFPVSEVRASYYVF
jgi:hypothetical protein